MILTHHSNSPLSALFRVDRVVSDPVTFHKDTEHILFCRETHAEDWPSPAGVHVPELHVAEDESGGRTLKVRLSHSADYLLTRTHTHTNTFLYCIFVLLKA